MKTKQFTGPFSLGSLDLGLSNVSYMQVGVECPQIYPYAHRPLPKGTTLSSLSETKVQKQDEYTITVNNKDISPSIGDIYVYDGSYYTYHEIEEDNNIYYYWTSVGTKTTATPTLFFSIDGTSYSITEKEVLEFENLNLTSFSFIIETEINNPYFIITIAYE